MVILFTTLAACKDTDNRVFGDDFDFPALTDENTIRFTVNVVGDWRQLDIVASGGRMVIDWGNGRIQKIEDPSSMNGGVRYKYGNKGVYEVRIWAEELQLIDISGLLLPLSNLYLGNMPRMKSLALNSISDTRELDLNTFCPNVESINIGSFADLEHLEIEDCFRLRSIHVYSNPKLASMEFGNHPEVRSLYCFYNGFSSLSLKNLPALRDIDLSSNEVLSHLELNENTSISAILIQGCAFQSITDILKCCPSLRELSCSYNKLTELDLSDHPNISELRCEHNQLIRLMVPQGSLLGYLYCHSNQLDENALNALFDSLGQVPEPAIYYPTPPRQYRISFNDNPGADDCNRNILNDKNWIIENK